MEAPTKINVSTLGYNWQSFDRYGEFDYSDRKRVLFLSDGGVSEQVPPERRSRLFISSDYDSKVEAAIRVNNNLLPFRPGSFDLIVMNRGLCPCCSLTETCGGIRLNENSLRLFLENIAGTLDPKNPESLALLTGYYAEPGAIAKIPDLFRSQLKTLEAKFPQFEFVELVDPSLGRRGTPEFIGIAIFPRGTSLALNLGDLKLPR